MKPFLVAAALMFCLWLSTSMGQQPGKGLERGDLIVDPENAPAARPAAEKGEKGDEDHFLAVFFVGQMVVLNRPMGQIEIELYGNDEKLSADEYRKKAEAEIPKTQLHKVTKVGRDYIELTGDKARKYRLPVGAFSVLERAEKPTDRIHFHFDWKTSKKR